MEDSFLSAPQGEYALEGISAWPSCLEEVRKEGAPWPCSYPAALNIYLRLLQLHPSQEEALPLALAAFQEHGRLDLIGGFLAEASLSPSPASLEGGGVGCAQFHTSNLGTMKALLADAEETSDDEAIEAATWVRSLSHVQGRICGVSEAQEDLRRAGEAGDTDGIATAIEATMGVLAEESAGVSPMRQEIDFALAEYNQAVVWGHVGELDNASASWSSFIQRVEGIHSGGAGGAGIENEEWRSWMAMAAHYNLTAGLPLSPSILAALKEGARCNKKSDTALMLTASSAASLAAWEAERGDGAEATRWAEQAVGASASISCSGVEALHPLEMHHTALTTALDAYGMGGGENHAGRKQKATAMRDELLHEQEWPPPSWGENGAHGEGDGASLGWQTAKTVSAGLFGLTAPLLIFLYAVARPDRFEKPAAGNQVRESRQTNPVEEPKEPHSGSEETSEDRSRDEANVRVSGANNCKVGAQGRMAATRESLPLPGPNVMQADQRGSENPAAQPQGQPLQCGGACQVGVVAVAAAAVLAGVSVWRGRGA